MSARAYARFRLGVSYGFLAAVVVASGTLVPREFGRGPLILVAVCAVGLSMLTAAVRRGPGHEHDDARGSDLP